MGGSNKMHQGGNHQDFLKLGKGCFVGFFPQNFQFAIRHKRVLPIKAIWTWLILVFHITRETSIVETIFFYYFAVSLIMVCK